MKRAGSLGDRLKLRALRSGVVVWGLCERLGLDIAGSTEGPPVTVDTRRREVFGELVAAARAGDGTIDAAACPYPVHELLTHLVLEHGLLLHGSNDVTLDVLEPRPAHDYGTELEAVVACDDGIWPLFYAVVARDRSEGVFTACLHIGRRPHLRRFYAFATSSDPADPASWTRGAVYALPRDGFRREWSREWVKADAVRPVLRVLVGPDDFPLRETVVAATQEQFGRIFAHLRAAKRARAAAGRRGAAASVKRGG
jgi:hypothetical protein